MSKRTNPGFTLIELVIVLVLLGILAAVAAPRFLDLSEDAENGSLRAQAGAIESAAAINFATVAAKGETNSDDVDNAVEVTGCNSDDIDSLIQGTLETKYADNLKEETGGSSFGDVIECTLDADGATDGPIDFSMQYVPKS